MDTVFWVIGNNLKDKQSVDLTFDTKESAEQEILLLSLKGFECQCREVNANVIDLVRKVNKDLK